jgi:hypothetical protein
VGEGVGSDVRVGRGVAVGVRTGQVVGTRWEAVGRAVEVGVGVDGETFRATTVGPVAVPNRAWTMKRLPKTPRLSMARANTKTKRGKVTNCLLSQPPKLAFKASTSLTY